MMGLVIYHGYTLEERQSGGYRSAIGDDILYFDTAGQWKQYIDKYENKVAEKKDHRRQGR